MQHPNLALRDLALALDAVVYKVIDLRCHCIISHIIRSEVVYGHVPGLGLTLNKLRQRAVWGNIPPVLESDLQCTYAGRAP